MPNNYISYYRSVRLWLIRELDLLLFSIHGLQEISLVSTLHYFISLLLLFTFTIRCSNGYYFFLLLQQRKMYCNKYCNTNIWSYKLTKHSTSKQRYYHLHTKRQMQTLFYLFSGLEFQFMLGFRERFCSSSNGRSQHLSLALAADLNLIWFRRLRHWHWIVTMPPKKLGTDVSERNLNRTK